MGPRPILRAASLLTSPGQPCAQLTKTCRRAPSPVQTQLQSRRVHVGPLWAHVPAPPRWSSVIPAASWTDPAPIAAPMNREPLRSPTLCKSDIRYEASMDTWARPSARYTILSRCQVQDADSMFWPAPACEIYCKIDCIHAGLAAKWRLTAAQFPQSRPFAFFTGKRSLGHRKSYDY